MSEYDKMHDYLNDQTFYDKFPEAWKVKKLYDEKVKDLERKLAEARKEASYVKEKYKEFFNVVKNNWIDENEEWDRDFVSMFKLKEKGDETR
jgi:hypothetical protein